SGPLRFSSVAFIGLPPLILSLLAAWLAARYLEARTRLWRVGTALVALACGLVLGALCLQTARFSLWTPSYVALAADSCLIAYLYLSPNRIPAIELKE